MALCDTADAPKGRGGETNTIQTMFRRKKEEDPQRLVVLHTYQRSVDAEMAASLLRSAGIDCQVLDENVALVMPYLSKIVRLVVRAEDLERAREILPDEPEE